MGVMGQTDDSPLPLRWLMPNPALSVMNETCDPAVVLPLWKHQWGWLFLDSRTVLHIMLVGPESLLSGRFYLES